MIGVEDDLEGGEGSKHGGSSKPQKEGNRRMGGRNRV